MPTLRMPDSNFVGAVEPGDPANTASACACAAEVTSRPAKELLVLPTCSMLFAACCCLRRSPASILPTCIGHGCDGQRDPQTCRATEPQFWLLSVKFRYTLAVVVSCRSHLKACNRVPTVVPTSLGLCNPPELRQNRAFVIRQMMWVHHSRLLVRTLLVLLSFKRGASWLLLSQLPLLPSPSQSVTGNAAHFCFLLSHRPISIVLAMTYFSVPLTMSVTLEALPSLVFGAVSPPSWHSVPLGFLRWCSLAICDHRYSHTPSSDSFTSVTSIPCPASPGLESLLCLTCGMPITGKFFAPGRDFTHF